jgi:hypothetical protein
VLLTRDGADSQATVTIHRATKEKIVGAPFSENNSRPLTQTVLPPATLEAFGVREDAHLMSEGEKEKELLVIVKRGLDADISERQRDPYHPHDIRSGTQGSTWPAIKSELDRGYLQSNDDYERDFIDEGFALEADVYNGVNEYVWDGTEVL